MRPEEAGSSEHSDRVLVVEDEAALARLLQVVLAGPEDVEPVSREVVERFAELAPTLYDREDATRGHIDAEDRQGRPQRSPLLTISIGAASTLIRDLTHRAEVVAMATEMKAVAKRTAGSRLEVDRRREEPWSGPDARAGTDS